MPRVVVIQQLRGLAALGVVLFHIMEGSPQKVSVGAAGVDVFFVISGFIMWSLSDGRSISPAVFLFKRIARVAPPYWVATLLLCCAALMKPNLFRVVDLDGGDLLRSLAFIPYVNSTGAAQPLLLQGWTLNYEVFFYLIFAAVLMLKRRLAALTLIMVGLVTLHSLGLRAGAAGGLYTDPLLLEFTAGAWLGAAHRRGRLPGWRLSFAMLLAGVASLVVLQVAGYRPDAWRALAWGAPALMIVGGALGLERAGRAPALRPLEVLGDWSYSLYLTHVLVLNAASVLAARSFALYAVVGGVGCLVVAAAFYLAVERPLHLAFSRRQPLRLATPAPAL